MKNYLIQENNKDLKYILLNNKYKCHIRHQRQKAQIKDCKFFAIKIQLFSIKLVFL